MNKKLRRKKNTHTIRTDFGFNLLHSASKLKKDVIEGTGELFWFFVIVDFSSPIFLLVFMCRETWWGHCPCIVFSQICFILLCLFFVGFFSQPDVVNITWFTGHIHCSIVDKIDPTSEDVERVKNTFSITLGYIFLWNVNRRIYLPCLQLISKKYFWCTVTRTPPFY